MTSNKPVMLVKLLLKNKGNARTTVFFGRLDPKVRSFRLKKRFRGGLI